MGENFFEATEQLQGDGWDAVMNYTGFADPILHWLSGYEQDAIHCDPVLKSDIPWDTKTMLQAWNENLASVPWQITLQQFNLLDSHDTPRLLTLLNGDKALSQLAAIAQFTFPGVPCLYYGDRLDSPTRKALTRATVSHGMKISGIRKVWTFTKS